MRKYALWALGGFVVFYVLKSPAKAAHSFDELGGLVIWGYTQLSKFVSAL